MKKTNTHNSSNKVGVDRMEVEVLRRELEVVKRGDDVVGPDVKETQRRQPKAKYPAYFPEKQWSTR